MYSVSLAGYTNAGKSTLMNALTDAGVVAKDKLFATLDTRTRRWMLPGWGPVLLSDTVGFIRDLPHRLIASFRATLEETRQADMLLHVADASNPNVLHQISSVYKVLQEIGIDEKDTLLVLNKVDCEGAAERVEMVKSRYPNAIAISAKSGLGLTQFSVAVSDALTKHFAELEIRLPLDDGKTMAWLAHNAEIISKQYNDDHALVHCRMPSSAAGKLASQGIDLRVIAGKLPIAAENRDPDRATFMPVPPASNETVDGATGNVEEVA
jgi:GTP-binding protein HflX